MNVSRGQFLSHLKNLAVCALSDLMEHSYSFFKYYSMSYEFIDAIWMYKYAALLYIY